MCESLCERERGRKKNHLTERVDFSRLWRFFQALLSFFELHCYCFSISFYQPETWRSSCRGHGDDDDDVDDGEQRK